MLETCDTFFQDSLIKKKIIIKIKKAITFVTIAYMLKSLRSVIFFLKDIRFHSAKICYIDRDSDSKD